MKKFLNILLIIIIIVGITGTIYFFYQTPKNKNTNNKVNTKQEATISSDLFGEYYNKAKQKIQKMTMEEKIGQLFLVRFDPATAEEEIITYHTGGYILFAKDFENETKESIKQKIDLLQSKSAIPLIMSVDEEGGTVTRVSRFKNFRNTKFMAPKDIYDDGGYELLETTENEKAQLLLSIGINLNLAPDADVSTNENDFIYNRSFRSDATTTSEYITNMVTYANSNGISSCLKHFPGYGNNADTHFDIAKDDRTRENFETNDLLPFKAGIKANVPSILVEHTILNAYDSTLPASLSKNVHDLLKNDLMFSGIIMTDDLAMDAVKQYVDDGKAATLAINAGNDMIITSDFKNMYSEVLTSVNDGLIAKQTIDEAVTKVIAWKYAYGLF